MVRYPNLESAIAVSGIKKKAIAEKIGISQKAFHTKLKGETSFSWEQACAIQSLFPGMTKEYLFRTDEVSDITKS